MRIVYMLLSILFTLSGYSQVQVTIAGKTENIYPLQESFPFDSSQNLLPADIFKTKQIVGIGEATHGTEDFFVLKKKFFQFLSTQCGYTALAVEAPYAGGLFINDYIQRGEGNIDSVIRKLEFSLMMASELKELIEWMRDYNRSKPEEKQLSFYGFDMQSFYRPIDYLESLINTSSTTGKEEFSNIIAIVKTNRAESNKSLGALQDKTLIEKLLNVHTQLSAWFGQHATELNRLFSSKKMQQLQLCVQNFKQAVLNISESPAFRDSCMASTVKSIHQLGKNRLMIWAHNMHIGNRDPLVDYHALSKPMGQYLTDDYGDQYYPIGLVFNQGRFLAFKIERKKNKPVFTGIREISLEAMPKGSLGEVLSHLGPSNFFIPLRQQPGDFFSIMQTTYNIGATFYKKDFQTTIYFTPEKMFSALIFVNTTTALKLLP